MVIRCSSHLLTLSLLTILNIGTAYANENDDQVRCPSINEIKKLATSVSTVLKMENASSSSFFVISMPPTPAEDNDDLSWYVATVVNAKTEIKALEQARKTISHATSVKSEYAEFGLGLGYRCLYASSTPNASAGSKVMAYASADTDWSLQILESFMHNDLK